MSAAGRFYTIIRAGSLALLASCEVFLPPHRESAGAPGEQPSAVEASPPEKAKPPRRPRNEVAGVQAEGAFDQIRHSLRRLVVAEQGFFAETGAYTQDLNRMAFRKEGATELEFLWLDRDGYAVRGTHPGLPGRDCVIFVGATSSPPVTRRYRRGGRPGVPVCDVPSGPRPTPPDTIAQRPVDTTSALEAVSPSVQMKVDLRKMIQAQDAYHGTMGTYSPRIETLPIQFAWQDEVEISIVSADARSWSARATHARNPGKSCVIWFGPVTQRPATEGQRRSPQRSGIPVCDG